MKQDKKTLRRILQLLKDIDRNGYEGIGKPVALMMTERKRHMDSTEEVIRLLDSMAESGVSRIKVETSMELEAGETKRAYHHGRCDVGSPFATGKLFDLEE